VSNDGGEVGVADLIEGIALGKRERLDFQVVVVRDTLNRGFGIVAPLPVLIVEMSRPGSGFTGLQVEHLGAGALLILMAGLKFGTSWM
jgi:hypothetical protein